MLSTKTRQLSSSFLRQLLGHPRMIVFGFIPPRPAVWILRAERGMGVDVIEYFLFDRLTSACSIDLHLQVADPVRDIP